MRLKSINIDIPVTIPNYHKKTFEDYKGGKIIKEKMNDISVYHSGIIFYTLIYYYVYCLYA